jgi:hypothetical protein
MRRGGLAVPPYIKGKIETPALIRIRKLEELIETLNYLLQDQIREIAMLKAKLQERE